MSDQPTPPSSGESPSETAGPQPPAADRVLSIIEELESKLSRIQTTPGAGADKAAAPSPPEPAGEADAGTLRSALEERDRQLQTNRELIEQLRVRSEELERETAAMRRSNEEDLQQATQAAREAVARYETACRQLTEASQQRDSAVAELESLRAQVSGAQDNEARRVADLETTITEQRKRLEECSKAVETADRLRQQVDKLTEELAAARVSGNPRELAQRDERIRELTEALRQARGQTGDEIAVGAIEQENSRLKAENDDMRLEVERLQLGLESKTEQLDDHLANAASKQQDVEDAMRRLTMENKAITERANQLEQELSEVAVASGTDDELAMRWRQLEQATRHLRLRYVRLQRLRKGLRERRRGAPESGPRLDVPNLDDPDRRSIANERLQLEETRRVLAASERKMVRAWARPRAVIAASWCIVALAVNAVAAWFAADHYFPATVAATVTIEGKPRAGDQVPEADMQFWHDWHVSLLESDRFASTLAKRLNDRRIDNVMIKPERVHRRLAEDLTVDGETPGEIVLTLTGTDPALTCTYLDVLASTVVHRSKQDKVQHGARARAIVLGKREDDGRVRYATLNPTPVVDERLMYAGLFSLIGIAVTAGLSLLFYRRLVEARRVFDAESAFTDEADQNLAFTS